jgi:hypothetical protein
MGATGVKPSFGTASSFGRGKVPRTAGGSQGRSADGWGGAAAAPRPEHASRLGAKTRLLLARSATVARDERSPCFAHPAGIAGFWLWRARGLRCCPRDSLEGGVTGRLPGRKIPPDLFEVRSDGVEGIAAEGHP